MSEKQSLTASHEANANTKTDPKDYGAIRSTSRSDETDYYFAQKILDEHKKKGDDPNPDECPESPAVEKEKPPKKKRLTLREWVVLISLAYGNLAIGACISLQAPFFPQEAENKGASPAQYGLIFGVYQLTMFVFAPICGTLLSYISPKILLDVGMLIVGTAAVLFGLLDRAPYGAPFIGLAFAIRIVEGVGSAAVKTGMYTYIAMKFSDRVATTFATLETFLGLGLIIGPTLGGLLYDAGGYQLPFFVVGSVTVADSVVKYFILDKGDGQKVKRGDFLKFYKNFGIFLYAMIVFTTFVLIGFNQATLEPHLREFKLPGVYLGAMFAIQGGIYSITAPIWGKLSDWGVNVRILGVAGCVLTACCLVLIGPLPFIPLDTEVYLVAIALALFGLGVGGKIVCTFLGVLKDTIDRGFPPDVSTYGLVSSLMASSLSLGAFVGPSVGGVLLEKIGFRSATLYLFILEILLIILLISNSVYRAVTQPKVEKSTTQERLDILSPAVARLSLK